MTEDNYNSGFRDGIMFVVNKVRAAADVVERPPGPHRTGQPYFARKLRELADELERVINQ